MRAARDGMFSEKLKIDVNPELYLRSVELSDAGKLFELISRNTDHLRRFLPSVAAIDSMLAVRAHIRDVRKKSRRSELLEFHIIYRKQLCGALRLNYFEPHNHKISIGYFLDKELQGRGIITNSARAVINYCFDELGLNRIELRVDTCNYASIAVAERLGFRREGELIQAELIDQVFVDHYIYCLLRGERHKLIPALDV